MGKKESQQPGDSTEQKIFDAAHEVFTQKGMDGAKMQEIADRAGINKALLHYYYRSKEKLYEMVAKAVIGRAVPVIQNLIESDEPLEQKITRFGQLLNRFDTIKIEQHSKHLFMVHSQRGRKMPQITPAAEISQNFSTVKE